MLHSLFILFAVVHGQFGSFGDCYDGIYCSEDLEFIIPNKKCSKSMSKNQDEFYFRWLKYSVIEIEKASKISLIFSHLNSFTISLNTYFKPSHMPLTNLNATLIRMSPGKI